MQGERLKILLSYVEEEPEDPFNRYALAMEYLKIDQQKALEHLQLLHQEHPAYLALYYQLGSILLEKEAYKESLKVLEEGLLLAHKQDNAKATKEIGGLLQQVKDELEEW